MRIFNFYNISALGQNIENSESCPGMCQSLKIWEGEMAAKNWGGVLHMYVVKQAARLIETWEYVKRFQIRVLLSEGSILQPSLLYLIVFSLFSLWIFYKLNVANGRFRVDCFRTDQ